ncbi:hypothetical protein [Aquimarina macrocephali]|nr:hypothetical protein [Aquimarina macrocephali]
MGIFQKGSSVDITPYLEYVVLAIVAVIFFYNAGVAIGKFIYHIKH